MMILISSLLASCIGTVEDLADVNRSIERSPQRLNFEGIASCDPISNNAIEVRFRPATPRSGSVDPDNIVYNVYSGGNYNFSIASDRQTSLRRDSEGFYSLVVEGLSTNRFYTFVVRASDLERGSEDENTIACGARTLTQEVPIFDGLQEVLVYPGLKGQDTLLLKWTPAKPARTILGQGIAQGDYKIDRYQIYWSDTTDNPDEMELLTTLTAASVDGVNDVLHITDFEVRNLSPGRDYHFMIRAEDQAGRRERNRRVISAQTVNSQVVVFEGIDQLVVPMNSGGFQSLRAKWRPAVGDFTHYYIIAVPEGHSWFGNTSLPRVDLVPTDFAAGIRKSKYTDTLLTEGIVQNLEAYTEYSVFVVACLYNNFEEECDNFRGHQKRIVAETRPPLAPFSGIAGLTPFSGTAGLREMQASWVPPVLDSGVATGIFLYQEFGDEFERVPDCSENPPLGTACIDYDSDLGEPLEYKYLLAGRQGVSVGNLSTGVEACFKATVFYYADGDEEGEYFYDERENSPRQCITLNYIEPVFQNAQTCTALDGGTRLLVNWEHPNPAGLYNEYIVFYKPSSEPFYSNFRQITNVSLTSTTIGGLEPQRDYDIKVVARLSAFGDIYDSSGYEITCRTNELALHFGGWEHVMSIGPRISGLASHRESESVEYLAGSDSLVPVEFDAWGIETETLVETAASTFPKVVRGATAELEELQGKKGKGGIVQLSFRDFRAVDITGDFQNVRQFLDDNQVPIDPEVDGYYVYRRIEPIPMGQTYETISIDPNNWTKLNTEPIPVTEDPTPMTIVDYLPESFHPLNSSTPQMNTGRVVYYTVRLQIGESRARFFNNVNHDSIIPVIVPPANMTSVHRWMANKKICDLYGLSVDRNNNYRCEYSGVGGTRDPENPSDTTLYFDSGGHTLINRFPLGCNFTRFDTSEIAIDGGPKNCRNPDDHALPLNHRGAGRGFAFSNARWLDQELTGVPSTSAPWEWTGQDKSGDCIGRISDPEDYPFAWEGTVFYNGENNVCYMATGHTHEVIDDEDVITTIWEPLAESDPALVNRLPKRSNDGDISSEFLQREYVSGTGKGTILSSNHSSLPPIIKATKEQSHYLCQSHMIQIRGETTSPPIRKRLLSGQEHIISSLPHPSSSGAATEELEIDENIALIQQGTTCGGSGAGSCAYEQGLSTGTTYRFNRASQAPHSDLGGCYTTRYYNSPQNINDGTHLKNLLTKNVRNSTGHRQTPALWVSGSYDVLGEDLSTFHGTERCVSGFGVQDYVGNVDYWLSDQALCHHNGGNAFCYTNPSESTSSAVNSYVSDNTWPSVAFGPIERNSTYFPGQDAFTILGDDYLSFPYYEKGEIEGHVGLGIAVDEQNVFYPDPSDETESVSYPLTAAARDGSFAQSFHLPFFEHSFSFTSGVVLRCQVDDIICQGLLFPDRATMNFVERLPAQLERLENKFFYVKHNVALPDDGDGFFTLYRKRNTTKTGYGRRWCSGGYNCNWFDVDRHQHYRFNDEFDDGEVILVTNEKASHFLSLDWKRQTEPEMRSTGARCAVKVDINLQGEVITVDRRGSD